MLPHLSRSVPGAPRSCSRVVPRSPLPATCVALALLVLALAAPAARACNGDPALCDRPYDEVAYLTTHNAHSNSDYGFTVPLPNQLKSVTWQLEHGVRALMLDTYLYLGRAYLCHGVCGPWGKKKLRPVLEEIRAFVETHPQEVVTIILESYLSEERTAAAFSDAGLLPLLYSGPAVAPWPTLGELIAAGTPVVVFTDDAAATLPWHHYIWDSAWEVPFDYADVDEFTCRDGRGTPGSDLFIFNHFITTDLGSDRAAAASVNRYALLHNRAVECWGYSDWNPDLHLPNYITLDHFDLGAGDAVVRTLNESWPEPPLWLTATEPIPGAAATLQVSGVEPGAAVTFVAGFDGQGRAADPLPQLGGVRLDLLGTPLLIGSVNADSAGVATLERVVPPALAGDTVSVQAVVPRGAQPARKSIALDLIVATALLRASGNPPIADRMQGGLPPQFQVPLHDCNGNGRADRRDISAGSSSDCDGNGIPDECAEFGLAVEEVTPFNHQHEWGYAVITTGARFEVLPSGITLYQRLDPAANAPLEEPLAVAQINFSEALGPWTVECFSAQSCRLAAAGGPEIEIGNDSMALLRSGADDLVYTFQPLLSDPTWFAERGGDDLPPLERPAHRFWERSGAGMSHMVVPGSSVTTLAGPDAQSPIHVTLAAGGATACAVFPARLRDLERLYGAAARPHVAVDFGSDPTPLTTAEWDSLAARGFGTLVLFNKLYRDFDGNGYAVPDLIDSVWQYSFGGELDPAHEALVQERIDTAHAHGFQVLAYIQPGALPVPQAAPGANSPSQEIAITLHWMQQFRLRHDLDGWYLDGANPYGWTEWLQNYWFVRTLRRRMGEQGVLYHHTSVDLWGAQTGNVVLAPLEAWVDYVHRGETEERAQVSGSNDPFIANIGTSHGGAPSLQQLRSHGSDITNPELGRLFQQNLWGYYSDNIKLLRDATYWQDHGRPYWEERRRAYRDDPDFSMAFLWPPAWYHELEEEVIVVGTPDSVTVSFTTVDSTFADVRVVYNAEHYNFNHADGNDQIMYRRYTCGDIPRREHFFRIKLDPSHNPHPTTAYRVLVRAYRGTIRECNPGGSPPIPDETMLHDVWGTAVTTPGDCNDNGVDDATDIRNGTSEDTNDNGIPDECE